MVSSALSTLRNTPQDQEGVFNKFAVARDLIILDTLSTGQVKITQMQDAARTALDASQTVLDSINAAAQKIEAAASVAEETISDSCRDDLHAMLKAGLDITKCAQKAVELADRSLLSAVKRHVRLVTSGRAQEEQLQTIAAVERSLYNASEIQASSELRELGANIGTARLSAQTLLAYFQNVIDSPGSVSGRSPAPPQFVYAWIPFDERGQPVTVQNVRLHLADGLPQSDPRKQFITPATPNVPTDPVAAYNRNKVW